MIDMLMIKIVEIDWSLKAEFHVLFFFLADTANGIRMRLNVGGVTNYM